MIERMKHTCIHVYIGRCDLDFFQLQKQNKFKFLLFKYSTRASNIVHRKWEKKKNDGKNHLFAAWWCSASNPIPYQSIHIITYMILFALAFSLSLSRFHLCIGSCIHLHHIAILILSLWWYTKKIACICTKLQPFELNSTHIEQIYVDYSANIAGVH